MLFGLLRVDVEDERFPRALHAARVHVDLDEPVDRVDRRVLVLHPGDVVGDAIRCLAGLVELDERLQRLRHRLGRVRHRRLEVADDRADLRVVLAADPVDLLDQLAVRFTRREFSGYFSSNPSRSFIVTPTYRLLALDARMSLPGAGRLVRHDRVDGRIEEHRLQPREHASSDSPALSGNVAPPFSRRPGRRGERLRRALQHELARGQVVVGPGVEPEQLGVALNLGQRLRIDAVGCVRISSRTSRISRLCA